MKRKIVRRTYTLLKGKPSTQVEYISNPHDYIGMDLFSLDINEAYLFNLKEIKKYKKKFVVGSGRFYGDYAYQQDILNVKITIEE